MHAISSQRLLSLTLEEFLRKAGQRDPTPGGGAVAAAAAAMAVALGKMVCAYSSGPKTPPEDRSRLEDLTQQLDRLDQICRDLIEEDASAYQAFVSTSEKVRRQEASRSDLQQVIRLTVTVPLEVQALSLSLLRCLDENKRMLKTALHSDLAVSAHLAQAACTSAGEIMRVSVFNLDAQDDRTHLYNLSDHYIEMAGTLADNIVSFVHG